MSRFLPAAAAFALGLAAASPASAISAFTSDAYSLIGAEFLLLNDTPFETGPLAGEDFAFAIEFNDDFDMITDAFVEVFGVGPFGSDFSFDVAIAADDGDVLSLIATSFADGSFPQGLSIVLSGFGFGDSVLGAFKTAFDDERDIDFANGLTTTVAPVPLPAAGWMLVAGATALAAAGRRRA